MSEDTEVVVAASTSEDDSSSNVPEVSPTPITVLDDDSEVKETKRASEYREMLAHTLPVTINEHVKLNMDPRTAEELQQMVNILRARFRADRSILVAPPKPVVPILTRRNMTAVAKLKKLQTYIWSYEYNHIGPEFFPVDKSRPLCKLMQVAKLMIKEALPIKCLEAVVLAMYLTRDMLELVRFPLRFQSKCQGHTFWHIVFAVCYKGKYGTIGLSRRNTLDYRELSFESLYDLILSFKDAYYDIGHTVRHITVGLPFGRDEHSRDVIHWHYLSMSTKNPLAWNKMFVPSLIDTFAKLHTRLQPDLGQSQTNKYFPHAKWEPLASQITFEMTPELVRLLKESDGKSNKMTSPMKRRVNAQLKASMTKAKQLRKKTKKHRPVSRAALGV